MPQRTFHGVSPPHHATFGAGNARHDSGLESLIAKGAASQVAVGKVKVGFYSCSPAQGKVCESLGRNVDSTAAGSLPKACLYLEDSDRLPFALGSPYSWRLQMETLSF